MKNAASKTENRITDSEEAIDRYLVRLLRRIDRAHERGTFEQEKIALNLAVGRARCRVIAYVRSREGSRAWIKRTDDEPISGNVVRLRRRAR